MVHRVFIGDDYLVLSTRLEEDFVPCKLAVTSFGIPFFTSSNCYLTVPRLCVVFFLSLRLQKVSLITNLRPRHVIFFYDLGKPFFELFSYVFDVGLHNLQKLQCNFWKNTQFNCIFEWNNTFVRKKYRICFALCRKNTGVRIFFHFQIFAYQIFKQIGTVEAFLLLKFMPNHWPLFMWIICLKYHLKLYNDTIKHLKLPVHETWHTSNTSIRYHIILEKLILCRLGLWKETKVK